MAASRNDAARSGHMRRPLSQKTVQRVLARMVSRTKFTLFGANGKDAAGPLPAQCFGLACHMHEMAVATSILDLALDEMRRHGADGIERIVVEYGALAGIMPEALEFAFSALVAGTSGADIRLELVLLPLRLRCGRCGAEFGGEGRQALWQPCPRCGEDLGHDVIQGRELVLKRIQLAVAS